MVPVTKKAQSKWSLLVTRHPPLDVSRETRSKTWHQCSPCLGWLFNPHFQICDDVGQGMNCIYCPFFGSTKRLISKNASFYNYQRQSHELLHILAYWCKNQKVGGEEAFKLRIIRSFRRSLSWERLSWQPVAWDHRRCWVHAVQNSQFWVNIIGIRLSQRKVI